MLKMRYRKMALENIKIIKQVFAGEGGLFARLLVCF